MGLERHTLLMAGAAGLLRLTHQLKTLLHVSAAGLGRRQEEMMQRLRAKQASQSGSRRGSAAGGAAQPDRAAAREPSATAAFSSSGRRTSAPGDDKGQALELARAAKGPRSQSLTAAEGASRAALQASSALPALHEGTGCAKCGHLLLLTPCCRVHPRQQAASFKGVGTPELPKTCSL